jgi:hypothetical protein
MSVPALTPRQQYQVKITGDASVSQLVCVMRALSHELRVNPLQE